MIFAASLIEIMICSFQVKHPIRSHCKSAAAKLSIGHVSRLPGCIYGTGQRSDQAELRASGNLKRCFARSAVSQYRSMASVQKIKVANPVVDLDGDEMTR